MKAQCCPNTAFRKIARSVHEAARDVARQRSTKDRKTTQRGVAFGSSRMSMAVTAGVAC